MDEMGQKANIIIWVLWLVIIFAGSFIVNQMMRPFGKIAKGMEAVTEGYESNNLHVDTYSETEDISEAFNKMLGRMKILDDSRQEFVSNVSHELKTPLTSILKKPYPMPTEPMPQSIRPSPGIFETTIPS